MPDFSLENLTKGLVVGIDEAGRGPWAGPVVASAVLLDQSDYPDGINDSKKLSKNKRDKLYKEIYEKAKVGVGIASVEEIDQLNILSATKLAMTRAADELMSIIEFDHILVDGNHSADFKVASTPVIKGDSKSLSIAAASIIAKVTRDNIMSDIGSKFPYYNWQKNSGYGTKEHIAALAEYGVTKHHRKTYKPIAAILNNN